jgi:hypothetical protein
MNKINRSLDKAISTLGMELTASKTSQTSGQGQHLRQQASNHSIQKAFVVIGINTAFSSKKRRDSIRDTWLPKGMHTLLVKGSKSPTIKKKTITSYSTVHIMILLN